MKNVTAVIISFLRPGYTKACIESLRFNYPDIQIVVGDNGGENPEMRAYCEKFGARYFVLPYDAGVCVGRNELVKRVETKYILVGDDDFFYTPSAAVERMKLFLDTHEEFDLIGGRVSEHGILRNYQGLIERFDKYIHIHPINPELGDSALDHASGLRFQKVDLTFNYFVARTEEVRSVPWDEQIKVAYEHLSWFIDFKEAGGRVAYTSDAVVVHKPSHVNPEQADEYAVFRNRRSDKERFFKRYKLDFTITMNGSKDYKPDHMFEHRKNDTKFIDFCITTFKRPEALRNLLMSIAKWYPMANVYVADQNAVMDRTFYNKLRGELSDAGLVKRLSVDHLPYDCGVSYARNHLVFRTPNQFKLILDDDMEFSRETDIGKMLKVMETDRSIAVVGGLVRQLGHDMHFEFTPEKVGDTIIHKTEIPKWKTFSDIKYRRTGCVLNFALFRKDLFQYIQWDNKLKVSEHLDFYLRMKQIPYMIMYTPTVTIEHPPAKRNEDYKELRQRDEFQIMMLKKHGVKRVKYENKQVVELMPNGSLKRYKELT